MGIAAGSLRHRVTLQQPVQSRNETTGEAIDVWVAVDEVWAAVEPLSAREFIQSAALQAEVVARITIRYRSDLLPTWRIVHGDKTYSIEGILADKESGVEYLTLPVSQGVPADPVDAVTVIGGGDFASEPDGTISGGSL
jgi:SPP1 family predicted phage head-tail adaptor